MLHAHASSGGRVRCDARIGVSHSATAEHGRPQFNRPTSCRPSHTHGDSDGRVQCDACIGASHGARAIRWPCAM